MQSKEQHVLNSSLRVLHVIPSIASCRGGPSKAVIEMVSSLRVLGVDAEIATTNDNGATTLDVTLNQLIHYAGVPVRFFKRFSPPVNSMREFAYSGSFRRWFKAHVTDYDVIHIHAVFSFCSSYAMTLARKTRTPYVVRPIGQLQYWSLRQSGSKKDRYLRFIERANLNAANAVHFTALYESNETLDRFKELNGVVIPLGINIDSGHDNTQKNEFREHYNIKLDTPVIVYLSRLHEKKGLELLFTALANIKKLKYVLMIAGNGEPEYVKSLEKLSKELLISNKCHFLGHVDEDQKTQLLGNADLYALTSYSENFGISVLEAMAAGVAPLVSNGVALSQTIEDQQLGFVCNLESEDIESTLTLALSNLPTTRALGKKAQEYTEKNYSWPKIAEQLRALYKKSIKPI